MEDEIDLRKYILLLVNHWKWIAGVAVLFALVAYLVSKVVLSPTYTAEAILFIVQPQYSITFDARFTTQNKTDLVYYGPLDQVALADDLIQEVHQAWNEQGNSTLTVGQIRGMLSVEDSSSSSLELQATSNDPEISAELVNLWADIFLRRTEEIYTNKSTENATLVQQLEQAQIERDNAQQALIDFQQQNELLVFQSELTVTQSTYSDFLVDQAEISQGLQDIQSLQSQLTALSPGENIAFQDELTLLLLQMEVYNVDKQIMVNIESQPVTPTRTVGEVRSHLDRLATVLSDREQTIEEQLPPLEEKILTLQSQILALQTTEDQLELSYRIASDTYITLARKLEETKITNEVTTSSVRLASQAIVPEQPSGPNTLLNVLIGGAVGVILSIGVIFGRDIWKEVISQPNPSEHLEVQSA